jgi:hypothetical protein
MSDEDKKNISSLPPPPTDEIDGEWEDDETLVRDAPSLSDPPKVSVKSSSSSSAPPAASPSVKPAAASPSLKAQAAEPAETAAAPISAAPVAAASATVEDDADDEEEDDEEEDDTDEPDDEEEDDEEEEASAQPLHTTPAAKQDWIPEWGPFAVLGVLVTLSILIGLGIFGSSDAKAGEDEAKSEKQAPAAASAIKLVKPSGHP